MLAKHYFFMYSVLLRRSRRNSLNRELTQQNGWKTQDGRMTKKCGARLCIPGLTRHVFVILPSWVFQPSCCVSSLMGSYDGSFIVTSKQDFAITKSWVFCDYSMLPGHIVRNRRSVLSLAWREVIFCKGRERRIYSCLLAWLSEP